jgi:hypothetical protein
MIDSHTVIESRTSWRVGQRVSRKGTHELDTVVARNGKIKVKWDGGATSCYRHGERANVQLPH